MVIDVVQGQNPGMLNRGGQDPFLERLERGQDPEIDADLGPDPEVTDVKGKGRGHVTEQAGEGLGHP